VSDPALEHLAVKAYRRRLLARVKADEDGFGVARLAPGHRVAGVEPAAERRHEVWGLPGIHDVDLHALTYQREQCGEGLVEGHGRWIVAEEPRRLAVRRVPRDRGEAAAETEAAAVAGPRGGSWGWADAR
jgi:hypothetical protein